MFCKHGYCQMCMLLLLLMQYAQQGGEEIQEKTVIRLAPGELHTGMSSS